MLKSNFLNSEVLKTAAAYLILEGVAGIAGLDSKPLPLLSGHTARLYSTASPAVRFGHMTEL